MKIHSASLLNVRHKGITLRGDGDVTAPKIMGMGTVVPRTFNISVFLPSPVNALRRDVHTYIIFDELRK